MATNHSDVDNISNERLRKLVQKQIASKIAKIRQTASRAFLLRITDSFTWDEVREAARTRLRELEQS